MGYHSVYDTSLCIWQIWKRNQAVLEYIDSQSFDFGRINIMQNLQKVSKGDPNLKLNDIVSENRRSE